MALDITLSGSISGLSTVGGNVGPSNFSYALDDETQFFTQEILVSAAAAGLAVALPSVGTQKLFYLKTDRDVDVTLNAEPKKTLNAGGIIAICGVPAVTDLTFDGNGSMDAQVFVVVAGS